MRDKAALDHLFEAEKHLNQAGISFDTGIGPVNERTRSGERDWELDWSLKGAKLRQRAKPSNDIAAEGLNRYNGNEPSATGSPTLQMGNRKAGGFSCPKEIGNTTGVMERLTGTLHLHTTQGDVSTAQDIEQLIQTRLKLQTEQRSSNIGKRPYLKTETMPDNIVLSTWKKPDKEIGNAHGCQLAERNKLKPPADIEPSETGVKPVSLQSNGRLSRLRINTVAPIAVNTSSV